MRIINSLDHVREHPEMYLGGREPTSYTLASGLVECALISQAKRLEVAVLDDRWIAVCADADWISPNVSKSFKRRTINEAVSSIMPLFGGGQNAMRYEVVVTAFSENLAIKSHGDWILVTGELPPQEFQKRLAPVRFALVFQTGER
jgi:DNA gyrase/topoisomerase IV subunit B